MSNESDINSFSDERLVEMLSGGSKAHARLLYRRYDSRILRYHMRKGFRREEAEELTQETFFRVFRTLRNQGLTGRFVGLLYRAAYHAYVDYLEALEKSKKNDPLPSGDGEDEGPELPGSDPGGENILFQKNLKQDVWAAVSRLKDKQRLVMELHIEELSVNIRH